MRSRLIMVVGIGVVVVVSVAGVQLGDPGSGPEPVRVVGTGDSTAFAVASFDRLATVDHRFRHYRNSSNASYPEPLARDLLVVGVTEISDRQQQLVGYEGAERRGASYLGVDGLWYYDADEPETVALWQPRYPAVPWREYLSYITRQPTAQEITIVSERSDTLVIELDYAVIESGAGNATTRVTIAKPSGNIREIHQRTIYKNSTYHDVVVLDRYGEVEVSRPTRVPKNPRIILFDLTHGPIPIYEWL